MKLVKGAGNEKTGACWMSAIHWYTRNGKSWTDQPECVSPVVRALCIRLNDFLKTNKEREEVIGPHLFEPVGTRTTKEDEIRRGWICADRAVRLFTPFWLRRTKKEELIKHAEILERLAEIKDIESEMAARPLVKAANKAADAADAASAAYAAYAAYAADAAYAAYAADAADAASAAYAAYAAYAADAAYAAYAADAYKFVKAELLRVILDCCAVGRKAEVCPTKTKDQVVEFLCSFDKDSRK